MSEIIPILELVPVDDALDCSGCYYYKKEKCMEPEDGGENACIGSINLFYIWKEVTK